MTAPKPPANRHQPNHPDLRSDGSMRIGAQFREMFTRNTAAWRSMWSRS